MIFKRLFFASVFLFASSAAHAQINIPSIINVLADPSGTCANPGMPLQYNTQLNHLSACQGASPGPYSWALVSGGGGGSLILENNSVSQGSITNLNLLPGTNMSWTTSVVGGVGGVTPVISGLTTPAQIQAGQLTALTTTSSSTTIYTAVMALNDPLAAYAANQHLIWNVGSTACAGGAMTLNVDGLGAIALKQADGATNLTSAMCPANAQLPVTYDAINTVFRVQSPLGGSSGGTGSITTLSDSATVTWAIGSASQAVASLTFTVHSGSRTLNITNPATAGFYTLRLVQDGTGGEGLTLGTGCTWKVSGGGSGAITPSTGAGAIDVLSLYYDGTNCYANFNKNFN